MPKSYLILFWRNRLVWSRAHDWKSCKPQNGFEGSNPSFSAKKETTIFVKIVVFFVLFTLIFLFQNDTYWGNIERLTIKSQVCIYKKYFATAFHFSLFGNHLNIFHLYFRNRKTFLTYRIYYSKIYLQVYIRRQSKWCSEQNI